MKKIVLSTIILVLLFSFSFSATVFADDEEEIIDEEEVTKDILDVSAKVENIPKINARACLVLDRNSKRVLFEKNGYTKRAMASTTKIMTACIVLENAKLTDMVEVSKKAGGTGGSRLGLKANDKVSVNDLLYGLLLRSRK